MALVAINVVAYASVRHFDFVRFDDPDYVTANANVKAGLTWSGIRWAATTGFIANWHPLTWLSHMLDVQLFGVDAGAHHLTNVAFHIVNTLLLFAALRVTTGAVGRSAFVAALFAVHPLHVESVAWISERKDVLSTFFWMLAILAYVQFVRQPRPRYYAAVMTCFVLGLLAKPMVVTLPFVLLLLDVWPLKRIVLWRDGRKLIAADDRPAVMRLVIEKLPLFALAVASSIVTVVVQRRWGAVGDVRAYPLVLRFENAAVNYVAYIAKMVWPTHLAGFYPYRQSVNALAAGGAAALIIAITIAVVLGARRRPYVLVGWFWYVGTLAPVIGVIQAGLQSIADRYTYIPLIGVFIIVVWGASELAERWRVGRALTSVGALVIAACTLGTRRQAETWRDSLAMWQRSVDVTAENAYGQYNLGVVLVQAGRVEEGIARLREAVRIDPNYADVRIDLANALNQRGSFDEAIAEFAQVVRLRPDYAEARNAYGSLLRLHGKNAEAIAQFREAIRLDPKLASAHNELGNALTADGKFDEAMAQYSDAVRLAPTFAEGHNNLGAAFARAGNVSEATREFLEAVRLKPEDAMFHYNAALMLEQSGRPREAVQHLQAALKANANLEPARRALNRLAPSGGE